MLDREVHRAARVVSSGGIILYPTDTIWGIGCDATRPEPVSRIYGIKQRTDSKSMLVLVSGPEMLGQYVPAIPGKALELIRTASRPTTIIYPGARNLALNLLAPDGSVGIRVTTDEFCLKLIAATGIPIVSTSANLSAKPSPGSFGTIGPRIREAVDYVVDWRRDETSATAPSTIIRIGDDGSVTVIRP
jgi:L-threonylcarbamoyladenylate synthase